MLSRCFCIANQDPSYLGTDAQFNAVYSLRLSTMLPHSATAQIDVIQFSLPDAGVSEVID